MVLGGRNCSGGRLGTVSTKVSLRVLWLVAWLLLVVIDEKCNTLGRSRSLTPHISSNIWFRIALEIMGHIHYEQRHR
ncbi:hypothetical protein Y032_0203g1817 [Ancylostoma ceylanicum]|uniref:Uncharacterized protein n=1 Tax=Ancylostoma ceylanicum TaxID=53326 RepID=A0A016SM23_9BILA|nr:hypothetical protein Y032_0203g1817 [Ancylostoma ceylanicum]